MNLKRLQELADELNKTNSTLDKKETLSRYADLQSELRIIYSSFIQFYLTSKNVLKNSKLIEDPETNNLSILLMDLSERKYTGHQAIAKVNGFINNNLEYKELILNIIDKDLKCRIGDSIINDVFKNLISTFDVALANSYKDVSNKVDIFDGNWYASHKLDGCRNITIIEEDGKVRFFSREGKEFDTLNALIPDVNSLGLTSAVLDGEICIVDEEGKEDFQDIMKYIRKKDYTIPNPKYKVFDIMSLEEFMNKESKEDFLTRQTVLKDIFKSYNGNKIDLLEQKKINNENDFNIFMEEARTKNWEGLILRKNAIYKGKRSNDLLKVKDFFDAEYTVLGTENGPFRIIVDNKEQTIDALASVIIEHKGNKVNVGSGFSIFQRKLYKDHPEDIIGKTICVKYFEETTNKDGGVSLRFPTVKYIYEGKREV